MSENLADSSKGSRTNKLLGGLLAVTGATLGGVIAHYEASKSEAADSLHCTVLPGIPEQIPPEDIDYAAIQSKLKLSATQLRKVRTFPATCYVPEGQELEFSKGKLVDPAAYEYATGLLFRDCVMYGVPHQVLPTFKDETRPAVLACIDGTDPSQIVQI